MAIVAATLIVMAILGAVFGLGLAIAAVRFHVVVDPRVEKALNALPGINCGACGYAGCEAYAQAVVNDEECNLCVPGGHATAAAVAHIMGKALGDEVLPVRAVVHCQGGTDKCGNRFLYDGIEDCAAAQLLQAGPKACAYGCLGYGNCARACPFDAITMGEDLIPRVDWDKCTGCGACVKACPRSLVETLPISTSVIVACSSQDKGKTVKQTCSVGCISCWICVKKSPEGAVEKNGNLPKLTYPQDIDYAEAADACPMKCFVTVPRVPAEAKEEPVPAQA